MSEQDSSLYDADSIQVLRGLEGVRKRPGMYVGDTIDGSGLHHLLWELVSSVIDQHVAGYATELRVEVSADHWVTVHDDGPGIPVDLVPPRLHAEDERAISALELVFTTLQSGPTFGSHYPNLGVRFGVAFAAVSALSSRVDVETTRDGVRWAQSYERGVAVTALRRLGRTSREGTTIRFRADPDVFSSVAFDHEQIHTRLQELAWLAPHLRIYFQERRLLARGGLGGWARELARTRGDVEAAFAITQINGDVRVDLAMAWNESGAPVTRAFVNTCDTPRGTHVDALWNAFTSYARSINAAASRPSTVREALERGFTGIIHVGLFAPAFAGATRERLVSPEAGRAVARAVTAWLASSASWSARRFLDQRLGSATSLRPA